MSTQLGLEGLQAEWRKVYEDTEREAPGMQSTWQLKLCADELQPFLERLKGLEQQMSHEQRKVAVDDGMPDEMQCVNCRRCQLHALIHGGDQPARKGGDDDATK